MEFTTHPASEKKFKETIVLVPFYQSVPKQLSRHIELFNSLGFDVAYTKLKFSVNLTKPPISSKMKFGLKYVWADHVEHVLNSVAGDKIVFSFSNPSASAIEAIARRKARDIKTLICDSGPSNQAFKSIWRLSSFRKALPLLPLAAAESALGYFVVSKDFSKELHEDLNQFPKDFPILSIRGWRDPIIPPSYIDEVFEPHHQIRWQKLGLPEAEHLNGYRDYKDEYEEPVKKFLLGQGTPLKKSK